MILTVVLPLSAGEPRRAVALAGMMAIVSGVVCVATGLARLGFITELLSKPIRYGYMNGIALTVLLSQVPKLLGFSVTANGPVRQAWGIFGKVLRGNTNLMALAIGASTLALILLLRRWPRVPGILIAVVAATGVVAAFGLAKRGVSVLGLLPQGLPSPRLPLAHVDDLVPILMGGVAVDSVIQRILRHSNVATTQNHYIKTASPDAIAAMRQFSEALLCSTCAPDEGINPQGTVQ